MFTSQNKIKFWYKVLETLTVKTYHLPHLTCGIEDVPHPDSVPVHGLTVHCGGVEDLEDGGGLQDIGQAPAPVQVLVNASPETW